MVTVGIRELKNRLSEHIRMIRDGEEILVTDRGKVAAELRQPANLPGASAHPALARHARAGRARIGAPNRPELYPTMKPLLPPGTGGRLLDEERSGR
jgi:antitoxin (DNA-binding transcriptional repressor) of toxin-antitoxin stability system